MNVGGVVGIELEFVIEEVEVGGNEFLVEVVEGLVYGDLVFLVV